MQAKAINKIILATLIAQACPATAEQYFFLKGGVYDQASDSRTVYVEPIGELAAGLHVEGWEIAFMHRSQIGHTDNLELSDGTRTNNVENSVGISYTIKFDASRY